MKTKLLKKVRKRFVINKIITPPNVDCLVRDFWKEFKEPFYLLEDNCTDFRVHASIDENKCKEKLKKWIFNDYSNQRKSYRLGKREKVWYNKR